MEDGGRMINPVGKNKNKNNPAMYPEKWKLKKKKKSTMHSYALYKNKGMKRIYWVMIWDYNPSELV